MSINSNIPTEFRLQAIAKLVFLKLSKSSSVEVTNPSVRRTFRDDGITMEADVQDTSLQERRSSFVA